MNLDISRPDVLDCATHNGQDEEMKLRTWMLAGGIVVCAQVWAEPPAYQIFDIGIAQSGDIASESLGLSTANIVVGRSEQLLSGRNGNSSRRMHNTPS